MKIDTINVIEYADDAVFGVTSFGVDSSGEAEETFKKMIMEKYPDTTDEEMGSFLDDGYFEQGNYQIFLTHSS